MSSPIIVWFRSDLRVADNPALHAAALAGQPILPVYIYDTAADRPLGGASKWWLHHSLTALQSDLFSIGLDLKILRGNPQIIIPSLAQELGAKHVMWNRRYDYYGIETDTQIKASLTSDNVTAQSFKANLLFEPWEITSGNGTYYKVFTPFWRNATKSVIIPPELPVPFGAVLYTGAIDGALVVDDLDLLPTRPDWSGGFSEYFKAGSTRAHEQLSRFLKQGVQTYGDDRDRPDRFGTSRLSAHLAFGEISPRQIWHETKRITDKGDKFLSEIGWREFSYTLLYHNPHLARENFKPAFDAFTWNNDAANLKAWQRGQTGYPFVDAGMRELWQTGWQHNRVRMVTASFLIKHLRIDWRAGERWFWDTLVDADPASNAASWQWVAGSGADASPYFRIFNPFSQGQKFDPNGDYVRKFVPELAGLPNKYIHTPWEAPEHILAQAGVKLGDNYPEPLVEHKAARLAAMEAYNATRETAS